MYFWIIHIICPLGWIYHIATSSLWLARDKQKLSKSSLLERRVTSSYSESDFILIRTPFRGNISRNFILYFIPGQHLCFGQISLFLSPSLLLISSSFFWYLLISSTRSPEGGALLAKIFTFVLSFFSLWYLNLHWGHHEQQCNKITKRITKISRKSNLETE